ncbi:slc36a4 [Symbiodinium pilosum]|uniref:Slc36a4 protein n=1 Tax=Symbiodinium pilosum TaxID=2952 RepID=A0A812VDP7_SYMPI|nr:slc36a4 [Symbiodinium pilosum]
MESTVPAVPATERKSHGPTETTQLLKPSRTVPDGKATGPQLTLNLVVCGLGTGIFALPWSTAGASCTVSVLIVAAVLALNAWTIFILIEAAEIHQAYDIGTLLSRMPGALGRAAPPAVNAVIWIGGFFCLVSYVIVIADCAGPLLGEPSWKLKAVTSALVLPLCFLDQRLLSFTSTLSVLAVILVFALVTSVFIDHTEAKFPSICMAGFSWGSVSMFASMMQTVVLQMCVLPMYGEMRNRSPGSFAKVIYCGFAILFVVCASFALLGYLTFGAGVKSNVLLSLPTSRAGNLARLCAGAWHSLLGPTAQRGVAV